MLTLPILNLGFTCRLDRLFSRISRKLSPPSASEIHISFPCGSTSKDVRSVDVEAREKSSVDCPDVKEVTRSVQS